MLKKATSLLTAILVCTLSFAQLGGNSTYAFMNLSPSARVTALGGNLIAVQDDDVSLAHANPSLLNASMHQQLTFNHNFHFAGIQNGYAAYGHTIEKWRTTFHGGVQYTNYGELDATDVLAQVTGSFKVAEYAVVLGAGYQAYDRLTVGANIKWISSQLAGAQSMGIAGDLGVTYSDTSRLLTVAFVAKNIGTQLTTYEEGAPFEKLPFEMQLGVSKRLRYLPFRVSVIYRYFDRWNVLYDDPNAEDDTSFLGEEPTERSQSTIFFDNFLRHFVFNGEFLFGKKDNFRLRAGYAALLGKEMGVESYRSLAGFTYGVGIKINRFRLDYGRMQYHLAGGINHLSISTNFREFK